MGTEHSGGMEPYGGEVRVLERGARGEAGGGRRQERARMGDRTDLSEVGGSDDDDAWQHDTRCQDRTRREENIEKPSKVFRASATRPLDQ